MSLQSEIDDLRRITHELLFLGLNDEPIYSDCFRQLNTDVYSQSDHLYSKHGHTTEEEASLCIALLMGYNATIYNVGDKEQKIQSVLERSCEVLGGLSAALLKCQLLVLCYGEAFDEDLAAEAHTIIDGWGGRELTEEESEIVERLKDLEENSYPWSEVEE